jgi:hypothetical protein
VNRKSAKDEARRLVCSEGYTYAQAAKVTGIPRSTLEKYGSSEGWHDQRQSAATYQATIRAAKAALLERLTTALGNPDVGGNELAQLTHAWRQAEAAFPEHRYVVQGDDPRIRLQVGAEVLQLVTEVLAEVDRNALTRLQPHLGTIAQRWEAAVAA